MSVKHCRSRLFSFRKKISNIRKNCRRLICRPNGRSQSSDNRRKVQYSEPAFQPEVISDNKEESVPDEFNPNLDITLPEVPQEKAEPQAATPKYQQEYAAYVKDLQAIEQSGQALPNQELEDDLAQMGSEQRLEVDAEGKILNPFSQAQLINPMAEAPVRDASVPKAAKNQRLRFWTR